MLGKYVLIFLILMKHSFGQVQIEPIEPFEPVELIGKLENLSELEKVGEIFNFRLELQTGFFDTKNLIKEIKSNEIFEDIFIIELSPDDNRFYNGSAALKLSLIHI